MRGTTHLVGGLAAAAITTSLTSSMIEPLIVYPAALAGSLIPDICHPKSTLGRMIPIISRRVSHIFGHRTITHSLLFILATKWLMSLFAFQYSKDIEVGLIIGIISHIILDAMTPRGVKLLYPFQINFRFPLSSITGSVLGEKAINVILIIVIIMFIF